MSQNNIQQHCSVCLKIITLCRGVTNNLKFKINYCPDKIYYKDLKVGVDKLCHECYMKIVDSYLHQISTINRNIELDDLVETDSIESNNLAEDDSSTNLMEINNLIEISESNISTNLMEINNLIEISESNILTNLMEINDLIEISEPNISTNLMEIDNLIESTTFKNLIETNNLVNLIELIEAQKNKLIKNNLIEINQQFTDIKINTNNNNNIISIDKENFNQLVKLIIQKDLKIKTLTEQNNKNNLVQKYSFSQQMELLTTVLLKYQKDNTKYILDPEQF
ncbi:hypothetical protein F8M41_005486 [Gigaspora margarita]|uniref:Uncharacterized protein n=1 Tax=Gigaspora margarita TaxID=4874 RepID=A0A8H3X9Z4_GIGMA|nr:hypothetical protein F8M41_005486 [Gigaspora margarita]